MKPHAGETQISADLEFDVRSILANHPAEVIADTEEHYMLADSISQAKVKRHPRSNFLWKQ